MGITVKNKKPGFGVDPQLQQAAQNKLIKEIGSSGNAAANEMLSGSNRIGQAINGMQQAIPAARQAYANQAGQALAAGAAQAGRGGASAYGGALQGGLEAAGLADKFAFSAQQQLANAYKNQASMSSEGYATRAATAGKMLEFGTASERTQKVMAAVQSEIDRIIKATTSWHGDNTTEMRARFNRLLDTYGSDPIVAEYIISERDKTLELYSGIDGW